MNRATRAARRRWGLAVVLSAGLLAAGCSAGVGTLSVPDRPVVTSASAATSQLTLAPGLAGISEGPVAGATTTTAPAVGPGPATLNGTVLGPTGPVGGAVVQADRLVGDSVASARTTTAADGSWSLRNILGGRYRVRAWLSPTLDLTDPQVVFLAPAQPQSLTLQLTAYTGPQVSAAINPAQPAEGEPANLVVQVVNPVVSPDGVLAYQPLTGTPVSLVDGPGWEVDNGNPLPTGGSGSVLFEVRCTLVGTDPLSAQAGAGPPVALQMPACGPPPSAPADTTPGYQVPGTETTTTCPSAAFGPTTVYDPNSTTTTLVFGNC